MGATRRDEILNVAEREMRRGGIDAVSFRDIAAEIGIKSAYVHYHFPTKADLTTAAARYAERFLTALGDPTDPEETLRDRIGRLVDGYIGAFRGDAATCLCNGAVR